MVYRYIIDRQQACRLVLMFDHKLLNLDLLIQSIYWTKTLEIEVTLDIINVLLPFKKKKKLMSCFL